MYDKPWAKINKEFIFISSIYDVNFIQFFQWNVLVKIKNTHAWINNHVVFWDSATLSNEIILNNYSCNVSL